MMQDVYVTLSPGLPLAKAAFNKKTLFTRKRYLNLSKKLLKCYIWSTALYGADTWTFRKVDQKYLGTCEMWWWRTKKKIFGEK
jgi:hypothetical protein